jgi:hypothetical protein
MVLIGVLALSKRDVAMLAKGYNVPKEHRTREQIQKTRTKLLFKTSLALRENTLQSDRDR